MPTAPQPTNTAPVEPDSHSLEDRIEHIDPHLIQIEDNIRFFTKLDKDFVATIKEFGVITPVLARLTPDGSGFIVRDGQRRVLAAREAGRSTIPVYVTSSAAEEKTVRIFQQLVTNKHRTALADAEESAAYHQLFLEGMTPSAIARKTKTHKAIVEKSIAVTGNDTIRAVYTEHQLTLEQAHTLIEFDADPDTQEKLLKTAVEQPGQFDHLTQRLRDDREMNTEIARLRAEYDKRGIPVIDAPGYNDHSILDFTQLRSATGDEITVENYGGQPGHVVVISRYHAGVQVRHLVKDWKSHGLRKVSVSGALSGPMTAEQKAERKTVIENNRAWASAEKVRLDWIQNFISRKTFPSDVLPFTAAVHAQHPAEMIRAAENNHRSAHELLGIQYSLHGAGIATMLQRHPTHALTVHLALVLAALEDAMTTNSWRSPSRANSLYLFALRQWGYTPSEVEQLIPGGSAPLPGTHTSTRTGHARSEAPSHTRTAGELDEAQMKLGDSAIVPGSPSEAEAPVADAG